MKKRSPINLILLFVIGLVFTGVSFAQENKQASTMPVDARVQNDDGPQDVRGNLLKQLGLSQDQVRQIRRFNMERRPLMEEAQRKLREANRALDAAIYSDTVSEGDIEARLKEAQLAQAQVVRIRSMNELAIRRVLTPEQLTRFRNMRQRFENARENTMTQKQGKKDAPPMSNGLQQRPGAIRRAIRPNGQRP